MPEAPPRNVAFFFDFDGTISVSMWVERMKNWAVSDRGRMHVIDALSPEEVVDNFGGAERLKKLEAFLRDLRSRKAKLYVISHGLQECIRPHMRQVPERPLPAACRLGLPTTAMGGGRCSSRASSTASTAPTRRSFKSAAAATATRRG